MPNINWTGSFFLAEIGGRERERKNEDGEGGSHPRGELALGSLWGKHIPEVSAVTLKSSA